MSLVSILIPAHNAAPWIAGTIESALAQTWAEKEIIVVDDGSTDSTVTIAKGYENRGVKVISQEQQGASAARNRAWRESNGEWLQFLDADDLLAPDKIAHQMERARSLGPDYAYCARWSRFFHSLEDADYTPQPLCRDSEPAAWIKLKLRDNVMMHPAAWLVSRQLADRAGPWNTELSLDDDGEFFSRVVLTSEGVRHVDQAISYYRSNLSGSLSKTRSSVACQSAFASLEFTVAQLQAHQPSSTDSRPAIANAFQRLAYATYLSDPDLARTCELRALDFGGTTVRPGGGMVFALLDRLCGWRLALRAQDRWRRASQTSTPSGASKQMTASPASSSLRLPDFIGIGAPKAATTWITGVLDSHPGVYMTPVKETHFFDYPYTQYPFSKYAGFFADARSDQLAGEFSTDYLTSAAAPARVRQHLPTVKLIVSFRNPIDQIYSNYWHSLRQGFNCSDDSSPDFDTAIERHHDRLIGTARLGHHYQRWLDHFPHDRFLVIFQEDVQTDPAAVADRLWRFLDLPAPPQGSELPGRNSSERAGVSPRSQLSARVYNRLYFAANNLVLRPLAKHFGYEASMRLINILGLRRLAERLFFRRGYPPMTETQRQQLRALLADDIRLLGQLTGRDLSHWR